MEENKTYDLIIVGAGPAGITAGIYASRYKLDTLVMGKNRGGQIAEAGEVENWPGEKSIKGVALAEKMIEHLKKFEPDYLPIDVKKIEKVSDIFKISTDDAIYSSKSLILATGLARRKLGVPGEDQFVGRGVSYCFTCDGPFFKNRTVAVVGGSDAAVTGAAYMAEIAAKVYIVYRGEALRAMPVNIEAVQNNPKIEIIYKANIKKINGTDVVTDVELDSGQNLTLDGVFIEIGSEPAKELVSAIGVACNERGEIIVNDKMQTSVPGVAAAGDITTSGSFLRQAIVASGEGAKAAYACFQYIKQDMWGYGK
jgi:thioredoxin reductase (NADPH)